MTASKRTRRPSLRESDRLLQRIRTLVRQTARDDGAGAASLQAQRRELEGLKSEFAESVKRDMTGGDNGLETT